MILLGLRESVKYLLEGMRRVGRDVVQHEINDFDAFGHYIGNDRLRNRFTSMSLEKQRAIIVLGRISLGSEVVKMHESSSLIEKSIERNVVHRESQPVISQLHRRVVNLALVNG